MVGLLFQLGKLFFGQRIVAEEGALADIIQITRMNEGFFCERGLFLNGGKFFLLLGEGLTGFGKRLCLLVGLGGKGVQTFLLPLDFELGDGKEPLHGACQYRGGQPAVGKRSLRRAYLPHSAVF